MKKINVSYVDIKYLIESIPPGMKVPLKSSENLIQMIPDQILNEINDKSEIGKKYYIQLAKIVYKRKKEGDWKKI